MQITERHPFEGLTLGWLLEQQARLRRDHPFLIFEPAEGPSQSLTYAEFLHQARRVAHGLVARGVKPGDAVLVHLDNSPEFLLAYSGCALAGAIAVTTNTASAPAELSYYLDKCGARGAITQPSLLPVLKAADRHLDWIAVTETDCGIRPETGGPGRGESFTDLMRDDGPLPQLSDQDPISVQFTSGTTSRPKGVLWTHANALWTARVSSQHENLQPWDVHHTMLPLFHTNALAYSWLASLWVGATVVLQPKFSANRFWDVALRHKCTWSSIGAFMYNILKEAEIPKHHFRHWGNAFWNPTVVEVFGVTPISWYGMTETLTHAIVSTPFVPTPYGAIGRPAPEYGVHILREDGTPVDPGETGALMLRGRPGVSLFKEYLGDAAATAGTYTDDGLFDTGDQVVVLEDGNIKFGDRKKDMLKTGGENVSASEVEAVIMTVEGVTECAVIGRPDRLRTEVPVAFVTVGAPLADRPDEDVAALVIARCRERLAKFKVPQGVTILEDFPRSTLNKIAKAKLRDLV